MTALADVLAHPRDERLRDALAGALIEAGDPRGELIRAQTALAGRLPPDARESLRRRVDELFAAHGDAWSAPVRGWAEHRFHAGFIEAIATTGPKLLEHAEALLAVEPVQSITLTRASNTDLAALAKLPAMTRVARLVIRNGCGDKGVKALATSPHLAALASLSLTGVGIGPAAAKAIAGGALAGLRILSLTGSEVGDEGAAALAASPRLARLERLYLARSEMTDEGVAALAGSRHFGALQALCLGGNELTDEGAGALAKGGALGALLLLELNQTSVGDDGARDVAKSKALTALRRIDVRQTEVGKAGVQALQKRGIKVRASAMW